MTEAKAKLLKQRYNAEKRFKLYGQIAIALALMFLTLFMYKIFSKGYTAFQKTWIQTEVHYDRDLMLIEGTNPTLQELEEADYFDVAYKAMTRLDPSLPEELDRQLIQMVSYAYEKEVKELLLKNPDYLGKIVPIRLTASDDLDQVHKGNYPRDLPEDRRRISDFQLIIYDNLVENKKIIKNFNNYFFKNGDSRDPELAGIGGALIGSFYSIIICLLLAFPVAVLASIYLEEFAPKNKITDFIEININNLAAVPSIVYGLLALQILLATIQLPRSTPLVAGITLALMTLPRIIIPCRASLKAVPPSIREGALAVGASKFQSVFHHVVPLALPGTLSGTIIGLAQALGETAPLILIGMVAFVVDIPSTPIDPSSSLPVQVYLWSESAERGFVEKTSATIMMLLSFLIVMNFLAVYLRQKFEKRWN